MKIDHELISRLMDIIEKTGGKELRLETGNTVIYVKEEGNIEVYELTRVESISGKEKKGQEEAIVSIPAPSAGVFYRRPEPEAPPYVEVGSLVEPGDTLALIEVMKSFGPVISQVKGEVVEILAEDSKPVEYGQILFLIKRYE